ncbi:MAG: pseudouridine synthase [Aquabacterium sp.]|uniref:pseudouridine synthase n=1 Tax=Aquabacterium sp. TaxID=1872578 RepID=UPI003BD42A2B
MTSAPERNHPALTVLWQDAHYVAIHKPSGWLVHRTGLDAHETRIVLQHLRDQLGRPVYPVHRLDKGTSGVLLMALSSEAARAMAQVFEAHQIDKHYVAMVRGWPAEAAWTVDHALKPDDAPADAQAQAAQTHFRAMARLQLDVPVDRYPTTRVALVTAEPLTGRRHQIRRHLKHVAHPIIGDATHGKGAHNRWWADRLGLQRLWLHATSLRFEHPFDGQVIRLQSDWLDEGLNPDWAQLWRTHAWVRPDESTY